MEPQRKVRRTAGVVPGGGGGGGKDVKAALKYQSLFQDYQELLKETEAKKKKLAAAKEKKLQLLGEVKFLRCKWRSFMRNPSQMQQCRLKSPAPLHWLPVDHRTQGAMPGSSTGADWCPGRAGFAGPRTSAIIDLNETCPPAGDEGDELYGADQEPVKADKPRRMTRAAEFEVGPSGVNATATAVALSCDGPWSKAIRGPPPGKRKISWQDQVALRV